MPVRYGKENRIHGHQLSSVLRIRIRDPGYGVFLTPGSGTGMNNPDHISESLETIFFVVNYLNSLMRIQDPRWKKFGSGIRDEKNSDPQHCFSLAPTSPPPCYCRQNGYRTNLTLSLPAFCASGTDDDRGILEPVSTKGHLPWFFVFCSTPLLCLDLKQVRYSEFFWSNPQLPLDKLVSLLPTLANQVQILSPSLFLPPSLCFPPSRILFHLRRSLL